MIARALVCEQWWRDSAPTLPTETRMDAGFAALGEGVNSFRPPHVCARETSVQADKGRGLDLTQAGDRFIIIKQQTTSLLNYSNPHQRAESKQPCGLQREGLCWIPATTLTKRCEA